MKIKKINRIITTIIIILLIVLVILLFNIIKDLKNEVKKTTILDTIENYNYQLTDNDTKYFKDTFKELKDALKEDNKEEYVKIVCKLFIIDFYSLSSAINKNDVGGIQFIETSARDNFVKKAKDTIYNNIENNMYGDRTQELPTVKNVIIDSYNKEIIKNIEYYITTATIEYEKNMGYPTKLKLTLTENLNDSSNNHIEIIKIEEI